jgi:hypothetical protein
MKTITCYRPTGEAELKLVKDSGYLLWPPRLPEQPIFYPVTNLEYAIRLTQWNVTDFGKGYVTKFEVSKEFMDRYPIKIVGDKECSEWWVPAEELDKLNEQIVGKIEVVYETDS